MCDGFSEIAAIAGTVSSVAGAGVAAYSAVQQGQAQKQAQDYQAQVARNNATVAAQNAAAVQDQATAKAVQDQKAGDLRLSAQRAAVGAAGGSLTSGSAIAVQDATIQNTGLTTAQDAYQGQLAAYGYRTQQTNYTAQAGLDTAAAENASTAGYVNAGSSLLSGASQIASKWSGWQQQSGWGQVTA